MSNRLGVVLGLERLLRRVPAEGGWCPSSLRPRTDRGYQLRCHRRRTHHLSSPPSRTRRRHRSLAHPPRIPRAARSAHSSATHSSPPLSRGAGSQCKAQLSGHRVQHLLPIHASARPILAWANGESAPRPGHGLARGGSWGASARSSRVPNLDKGLCSAVENGWPPPRSTNR